MELRQQPCYWPCGVLKCGPTEVIWRLLSPLTLLRGCHYRCTSCAHHQSGLGSLCSMCFVSFPELSSEITCQLPSVLSGLIMHNLFGAFSSLCHLPTPATLFYISKRTHTHTHNYCPLNHVSASASGGNPTNREDPFRIITKGILGYGNCKQPIWEANSHLAGDFIKGQSRRVSHALLSSSIFSSLIRIFQ